VTSASKSVPPGTSVPTLEDVRQQFVAAEDILARTAGTLTELRGAIEVVEDVRQGIGTAGETLRSLYEPLVAAVDLLTTGAERLEEGVTQLRSSEPGMLLRRLDSMEASLHSAQSATLERLQLLDQRADARSEGQGDRLAQLGGRLERGIGDIGSLLEGTLAANRALTMTVERVEQDLAATRSGVKEGFAASGTRMDVARDALAADLGQIRSAAEKQQASLCAAIDAVLVGVRGDLRKQETMFRERMDESRENLAADLALNSKAVETQAASVQDALSEKLADVERRGRDRDTALAEALVQVEASVREQNGILRAAMEATVTRARYSLLRAVIAAIAVSTVVTALVMLTVVVT